MRHGQLGVAFGKESEAAFSLTELLVALCIIMILMAIGTPSFLRAYHNYQLSSAASEVKQILMLARYQAINRNKAIDLVVHTSTSDPTLTNIWTDPNRNGVLDKGEKTFLLGPSGNLIASSGVPGTASLIAQAANGAGGATPSPTASTITFDARGAVCADLLCSGTSPNVNVYYLGSAIAPDAGYRAVVLTPAGAVRIWTSDASGNWQPSQ